MIKKITLFILSVCMLVCVIFPVYADTDENTAAESDDTVLVEGVDYTLEYSDNVKPGTARVIVTFIGNYSGQAEKTFNITRKTSGGGGGGIKTNSTPAPTATPEVIPEPTAEPHNETHISYINGYEDGKFMPEGNMTRAEAAAIFARNIADSKGETIKSAKSSFTDVDSKLWYSQYIAYLEQYKIINGYTDKTFKPEAQITRAEFVTMCVKFCNLTDKAKTAKSNSFKDAKSSHWAYNYINSATAMGWITGYSDGTFRPDNNITRAEVVTIVNRVTGREADTDYINKNMSAVNTFTDLKDKAYWAYYEILEAANTHSIVNGANGEFWLK